MSHPGVPEHVARNKYQAAQLRLGLTDAAQPAPSPAAPFSSAPTAAAPPFTSPQTPFTSPQTTFPPQQTPPAHPQAPAVEPYLPPLPQIGTFTGPSPDQTRPLDPLTTSTPTAPTDVWGGAGGGGVPTATAPANPSRAGFRPRYSDPAPILTQRGADSTTNYRRSGSGDAGLWDEWPIWLLIVGYLAIVYVARNSDFRAHTFPLMLLLTLVFGAGAYGYARWKAKRVAQRRFDQVTRIRPTWTRHNAVSCRSLGVGVKRAGSVWLADDGTAKDLVLAWSRDGFEIYGGERSLTRIISIPWQEVVEVRAERAAVGEKKGQAGLAIVTRSNAVLTAALRPEPSGYRKFKSRAELAPVVTQLRQFVPPPL